MSPSSRSSSTRGVGKARRQQQPPTNNKQQHQTDAAEPVASASSTRHRSNGSQQQAQSSKQGPFVTERMQHFENRDAAPADDEDDDSGAQMLEQGRSVSSLSQNKNNHNDDDASDDCILPHSGRHRRHHRASFRFLLAYFGVALLLFTLPYLQFATEHSNSCFITRSPRRMHADEMDAAAQVANATAPFDPPAADTLASSPPMGRARTPRWFYRNQTTIMLTLLLACLAIKVAYAWRFMRVVAPSSDTAATEAGSPQQQQRNVRSVRHSPGGSNSSSSPRSPSGVPALASVTVRGNGRRTTATPSFAFAWWEVYRILYLYLFYLASYFFCNALKSLLRDFSCSDHGNSVSGHYLFHLYAQWSVLWLHLSQKRLDHASLLRWSVWRRLLLSRHLHALDYLFLSCYTAYVWTCTSILSETYLFGFHSPRQILYGTLLAVVVFLAATGTLSAVETKIAALGGYTHQHHPHHNNNAQRKPLAAILNDADDETQREDELPAPHVEVHSLAHLPFVSTLLHEWCYRDEQSSRFYTYPAFMLFWFQVGAFVLLACAPEFARFFTLPDVVTVVLGQALLLLIARSKLAPRVRVD
jgi:hypothetical protein